jgi:threonine/homoserine/homoserine lactone efflux protein
MNIEPQSILLPLAYLILVVGGIAGAIFLAWLAIRSIREWFYYSAYSRGRRARTYTERHTTRVANPYEYGTINYRLWGLAYQPQRAAVAA